MSVKRTKECILEGRRRVGRSNLLWIDIVIEDVKNWIEGIGGV